MKGPEWKPGIFVQYTKENSLARGAGLKPGDQIIQCNNVVFTPDIPFTEVSSSIFCSCSKLNICDRVQETFEYCKNSLKMKNGNTF